MSMQKDYAKLLKRLREDVKSDRLAAVSRRMGIPYMTLSDIIRLGWGRYSGTLKTWIKIENHYAGRMKGNRISKS